MQNTTSNNTLIQLFKQIQIAQHDRARVYNDFKTSFKQFMNSPMNDQAAVHAYANSNQIITREFQEISMNVRSIEQEMIDSGFTTQASIIRRLQLQEKDKLETTVAIQKIQRQIAIEQDKDNREEAHEREHHCGDAAHVHHDCSFSHGAANADDSVLRGEKIAYLESDLHKFQNHMTDVINNINDILEEIRYEIEDLVEAQVMSDDHPVNELHETNNKNNNNKKESSNLNRITIRNEDQDEGIYL